MSNPDLTIEFGTPPPPMLGGKRGMYTDAVEALRKRPGDWARIASWPVTGKHDGSLTSAIRKGERGFSPRGAFEARAVKRPDGSFEVWARCLNAPPTQAKVSISPPPARPGANPPSTRPPAPAARPAASASATSIVRDLRQASDDSILCAECGHAKLRHNGEDAPACGRVGCTCAQYRKPVA